MSCTKIGFPYLGRTKINRSGIEPLHIGCGVGAGDRNNFYLSQNAYTTLDIEFDLYKLQSINYLYISVANYMSEIASISIAGKVLDTDTYTTFETLSSFNYVGIDKNDLFFNFTDSAEYQYYRVRITLSSSAQYRFSKCWVGRLYDIGVNPDTKVSIEAYPSNKGELRTTANRLYVRSIDRTQYYYSLTFSEVSNSIISTLITLLNQRLNQYIVIFNDPNTWLQHSVFNAMINNFEVRAITRNYNTISLALEDLR